MVSLEFGLLNQQERPVFALHYANFECLCLLDTGAQTPIFYRGVHRFLDFASSFGKITDEGNTTFYGFGPEPIAANIFKIEDFIFTDDYDKCIHFRNFKVLVIDKARFEFDMILPAPMFKKMRYCLDYTIPAPLITIDSPKDTYYTNFVRKNGPLYMFLTD